MPQRDANVRIRPLEHVRGNHRLDGDTALARSYRQRSPQCQYSLAHSGQTETEFFARLQAATVVTHPNQGVVTVALYSRGPLGRLDADIYRCCPGMAEDIGQRFLHDTVDRQVGGFSGFAE